MWCNEYFKNAQVSREIVTLYYYRKTRGNYTIFIYEIFLILYHHRKKKKTIKNNVQGEVFFFFF